MKVVSERTGVSIDEIMSYRRTRDISDARSIFIYISYMKGYSVASISKYLHGMTHQNISYQINNVNSHMKYYNTFKYKVDAIKRAAFCIQTV